MPRQHAGLRRHLGWIVLAAVTAVSLAAIGLGLGLLDPDAHKQQIADLVARQTGRVLTIGGKLRISRSLWPTIIADDVALSNLPGGTRPAMAHAEHIEAQLSLPGLLRRRIEVTRLTLIGPNILFEQVAGAPNWVFHSGPAPGAVAAPPRRAFFALRFRSVHVQNGMVTTRLPPRPRVIGIRSLDLLHPDDAAPLQLTAVLVYSDLKPFSLRATARPSSGATRAWLTQIRLAAENAGLAADGTMQLSGLYDLQVTGAAPALEKLNALLPELHLPPLRGMRLGLHVSSGASLMELPILGATKLHFDSLDLGDRVPGLVLGATDLVLPNAGGLAQLSSQGSLKGQRLTLSGSIGMPARLQERSSSPINVAARLGPTASLAIKGTLGLDRSRFDGLDGALSLRVPALADLRPLTAQPLPALTGITLNSHASVPADLASLALTGLDLRSSAGDLQGRLSIARGPPFVLDAALRSNRLDLDALLDRPGASAAASKVPADAPMFSDKPIDWSPMRGPRVTLTAHMESLRFRHRDWRQIGLDVNLKDSRLEWGRLELAFPGGPLRIEMKADAGAAEIPVALELHAPNLPLAAIARPAGLPDATTGTLQLEASLHGTARSARSFAASLDGPLSATLLHGSLSNAAFLQLAGAAVKPLGLRVPPVGETAITCLGLIGAFRDGVGRFTTLALDTSFLKLDGVGKLDLRAETVAFKLHPLARISGAPVSVPVLIEGPLQGVHGRLDASGLDKLGLLIDAWFGGDRPDVCSKSGLIAVPLREGHKPFSRQPTQSGLGSRRVKCPDVAESRLSDPKKKSQISGRSAHACRQLSIP